ncbi:hypothetical protein CAEBREN_16510 [Caenorhabditis brenneri]|uniref:Uncharacterized protein n=1 Tax=Caenorhabditis brenneri TaxID=135651 RepID=G0MWB4_CAEBE|nr:hypothetical protein CAEBREN_16510 [Caenorhabditis brenneri]
MITPGGSGGINGTVSTTGKSSVTQMSSAVENKKPFEFDRNSQKKLQLYSETVYFDASGQPKPSGTNGVQFQNQQLSTTQNQSSHVLSASYRNGIQGQPVGSPSPQIHHHQPVQQCESMNSGIVQQHHMVHSQSAYIQQQPAGLQQSLLMNPQTTYIQQTQPPMQQPLQVYWEAVQHQCRITSQIHTIHIRCLRHNLEP